MSNNFTEAAVDLYEEIDTLLLKGVDHKIDDKRFEDLALREFELQYRYNLNYRFFCDKRGITPGNVTTWYEICSLPAIAFKELKFFCFDEKEIKKIFKTGGTSSGKKGAVYHNEKGVFYVKETHTSLCKQYLFPDVDKIELLLLIPPPEMVPDMYMSFGIRETLNYIGTEDSVFLIGKEGLNIKLLIERLKNAEENGHPVALIGPTAAGFGRFFAFCDKNGIKFNLPKKSRIFDAGGYKGKKFKLMSRDEFMEQKSKILNIPDEYTVNVLGMTEVMSPFFDNVLKNCIDEKKEIRYKPNHPWTRAIAVNPETLQRLPKGEKGLLVYFDLLNLGTVISVQTDDLGYEVNDGFEILGRVHGADSKGCALSISEMLELAEGEIK